MSHFTRPLPKKVLASLETRAAVMVAVGELWRIEVKHPRIESPITLPPAIKKLAYGFVKTMKKSMTKWFDFHQFRVFYPDDKTRDMATYYEFLVWLPEGEIAYENTAKKLLTCSALSDVSKFRLACSYCFEDDIVDICRISDTLLICDAFKNIDVKKDAMLYYWICRMKNEPPSIQIYYDSLDFTMADMYASTWSAFQYFWNRLQSAERVKLFRSIFSYEEWASRSDWIMEVIELMSDSEFHTTCDRMGLEMVNILSRVPESVSHILRIWDSVKDSATFASFFYMIDDMVSGCQLPEYVSDLLYDIWRDTPVNLKNELFSNQGKLDELLEVLCYSSCNAVVNLPRNVRFIAELLECKDRHFRLHFWEEHWSWLIIGVNTDGLTALIELCLETDERIADFKSAHLCNYAEIEEYCDQLLEWECFEELDEFLNFCSPDPEVVLKLKKDIVWSRRCVDYCLRNYDDEEKINAFEEFAKGIRVEANFEMASKFQMVASSWDGSVFFGFVNASRLKSMKRFVRMIFKDPADIGNLKTNLLKRCWHILAKADFRSFDAAEWNNFLLWCMNGDNDRLDEFKRSLPVEKIFLMLFKDWFANVQFSLSNSLPFDSMIRSSRRCNLLEPPDDADDAAEEPDSHIFENTNEESDRNCSENSVDDENESQTSGFTEDTITGNISRSFENLNNFLKWYFIGEEKIQEFKSMTILHPDITNFTVEDQRIIDIVLDWFFNGDVERVENFKNFLAR